MKTAKRVIGLALCLVMVLSMLSVVALAADTTTVYCEAAANWATCKAYWWGSASDNPSWPGVDMTQDSNGLWTYDVPSDATGLIFNNGSGGGSNQTSDLQVPTDNKIKYVVASRTWAEMDEEPPVPEAGWYIAGTMNGWNCCDEAFKMTADGDGTYSLTISLAAGDHALKVTNGTWDVSFGGDGPDGNFVFTLEADEEVLVEFDGVGTVAVGGVTPPAPPIPAEGWYVAGTMNDWNCANEAFMMTDNGDGTYSMALTLEPGDHALKVTNGTWDVSFGGTGEGGNYEFTVVEPGNVVVSFDGATVTVSGDIFVAPPEPIVIESVAVAGSAGLLSAEWDPTVGVMTKNGDVYTITLEDVAVGIYEFKFTANGQWTHNWASGEAVIVGETATAYYNALGNSTIEITEEGSDVTFTLDLSAMDEFTGEGGTFVVTVETAPDFGLVGDVTGDTKINMADVAKAFAHVRNKNKLTAEDALFRADATGDGKINMADVARIFAHVRGKNPLN